MMQVYKVVMCAVTGDFKLDVNITKIEKRELLSLENPHYNRVLDKNAHLRMMTRRISYPFMLFSEQAILLRYTPENDCTSVAVVTLLPSSLDLDGQSCRQEQTKIYRLGTWHCNWAI